MDKGYQIIGEGDNFRIIKNQKSIISMSKIKIKHGFVESQIMQHKFGPKILSRNFISVLNKTAKAENCDGGETRTEDRTGIRASITDC